MSRLRFYILSLAIGIALLGFACTRIQQPLPQDELVVAVRHSPAFTQDENGSGFEQDLLEAFARELNLKLRVIVVREQSELMALLKEGKVHFAASATVNAGQAGVRYSTPVRQVRQVLVQHADAMWQDKVADLAGKPIEVLAGSAQLPVLQDMRQQVPFVVARAQAASVAKSKEGNEASVEVLPPYTLLEQVGMTELELLERVSLRKSGLAATDALHFNIAANFYPDLQVAQVLPGMVQFAWAFSTESDPVLFIKAQEFIVRIQRDGTLLHVQDRYFGHILRLTPFDISTFLERLQRVLPRYRRDFVAAQELTGLDWRLIAALAYQESGWDALATSYTNVRGMMMLTEETADRLNVSNRLDAKQSIRAGAEYLADLIDNLPAEVPLPDRHWIGVAAYNLGQGHMNGARQIAPSLKRDPNSWYEMKQVLPLLARPEYYSRLKSGRARGGEAVIMVENIRTYYDILCRFEPAYKNGLPASYHDIKPHECIPGQPCKGVKLSVQ